MDYEEVRSFSTYMREFGSSALPKWHLLQMNRDRKAAFTIDPMKI